MIRYNIIFETIAKGGGDRGYDHSSEMFLATPKWTFTKVKTSTKFFYQMKSAKNDR